jgi:hypothetical protein
MPRQGLRQPSTGGLERGCLILFWADEKIRNFLTRDSMGAHEQLIKKRIEELGCTKMFVAALAGLHGISGCSNAVLSSAIAGQKSLANSTLEKLWPMLDDLRDFVAEFQPVPIELVNAKQIYELMAEWRSGSLRMKTMKAHSAFIQGILDGISGEENGSI